MSAVLHADPGLVLRDIHMSPPPPWWPPAPGWWVLGALVVLALSALAWFAWRRGRRRRALHRMFDDAMAAAPDAAARIAAMSELLRRAAIRRDPRAAALHGEAWLEMLDAGAKQPLFAGDDGRLLLEGGFRPDVDESAASRLQSRARQRFLEWMGAR